MAFNRGVVRTTIIGAAVGMLAALAIQFNLVSVRTNDGESLGGIATMLGVDGEAPTWKRCLELGKASESACRCAAGKIDNSKFINPVFARLAFDGSVPAEYVPASVQDPARHFAEDVTAMETQIVAACQSEEEEDNVLLASWNKQCEADGNGAEACKCFYYDMKDNLSGEAWPTFRGLLLQDMSVAAGPFTPAPGMVGDTRLENMLAVSSQIAKSLTQCRVKAPRYWEYYTNM